MTRIALTQGMEAAVDDALIPAIHAYKWFCVKLGAGRQPYAGTKFRGRRILLHRYVMKLPIGDPRLVDHIDGNTLNNRRENQRVVDATGNARNRRLSKHNSSGVSGLNFRPNHGTSGTWVAYGVIYGKLKSKSFACAKHGYEEARLKALAWRKEHEINNSITVREDVNHENCRSR